MAGTGVHSLTSDFLNVQLGTAGNLSKTHEKAGSESFSDVMNKASDKSYKVDKKKEPDNVDKSIDDDVHTKKDFEEKLKEADESNEKAAVENVEKSGASNVITDAADKFKKLMADKLGISVEELEAVMNEMNIQDYQLFDTGVLGQLVAKFNDLTTSQDLLFNSQAMVEFKNIVLAMEEIKEELSIQGITVTDEGFAETMTGEKIVIDEAVNANQNEEAEKFPIEQSEEERTESVKVSGENKADTYTEAEENKGETFTSDKNSSKEHKADGHSVSAHGEENITGVKINPLENIEQILSEKLGRSQASGIMEQLTEQIKVNVNSEFKSMEMQLYPEHLGKVGIQIIAKDGAVTAQISAETEAVKKVLEAQLSSLKENLNSQGLKVENVEVVIASHNSMYSDTGNESGQSEGKKGRKAKKPDASLLDEINGVTGDEEQGEQEIMKTLGNTVSYQA